MCLNGEKKRVEQHCLGLMRGSALPHPAQLRCADGAVLCTIHHGGVGSRQLLFVVPSESNPLWAAQIRAECRHLPGAGAQLWL